MISVYKIKPYFQKLLMPILTYLHQKKITANQITIAAIVFSIALAITFWFSDSYHILFLLLPIGLLIRMALNALDGMMARLFNQTSIKGEVLNEVAIYFQILFYLFRLLSFKVKVFILLYFL